MSNIELDPNPEGRKARIPATRKEGKKYINGSCSVDRINCSLVIPVNRQRQSDGY